MTPKNLKAGHWAARQTCGRRRPRAPAAAAGGEAVGLPGLHVGQGQNLSKLLKDYGGITGGSYYMGRI